MLSNIFGIFSICVSSHFVYNKLLNSYNHQKYIYCITLIISLISSIITYSLSQLNFSAHLFLLFLLNFIFSTLYYNIQPSLSFMTMVVAYSLSFAISALSNTIVCIFLLNIYKTANAIPYSLSYLIIAILQYCIIILLMSIRRFRNGISYLIRKTQISTGIMLSIYFLFIINVELLRKDNSSFFSRIIMLSFIVMTSISLLFYWRYRITKTYREKLRLANEKSLEDEIANQKEAIADLEADNARLAQIVHKDNKIIHAMLTAVIDHLENTTNATPTEQISRGKELCAQLQDMAKERQGILQTQLAKTTALPKSGLHTVDGMLSFMETRAKEVGITYKLHVEENMKELAGKSIEEADLLHLLGDLIDNALIATKHANAEKEVLIHLGSLQGHFLLEISDSGIPFSLDTYQSLGNEPHTTHANEGGSGIGLMDIWKIKKKYKASLHICEYTDRESIYTKKLTFIFDHKNRFLLQTHRHKEAIQVITRGDLYIFPDKKTSFTD